MGSSKGAHSVQLLPDLTRLDLSGASSLASKRLCFLRWFVDQWPRLYEWENRLTIRSAPPNEPVDDDGINGRRAVVVVDDMAIEWWRAKGDSRLDKGRRSNGRYVCERIYTWQNFMARVRSWLVINGWESARLLRDGADTPEYATLIANHHAAEAARSERHHAWLVSAAHDADPALGELMCAVSDEDFAGMERLSLEPRLLALGLKEREILALCHTIRTADGHSVDVAKRDMFGRIGMLTFGVWQSRGQAFCLEPDESLEYTAAFQRYSESLEAVKAAALDFYSQRFEQWGAHAPLSEIGDRLFAGQAYVDPFAST